MVDYEMVHYAPSQVASAAFALMLKVLNCGDWVSSLKPHFLRNNNLGYSRVYLLQTPTLQYYMGYTEDSLTPVMQHIAKNVVKVNEGLSKHLVSGVCMTSTEIPAGISMIGFSCLVFGRRLRTSTPVRSR